MSDLFELSFTQGGKKLRKYSVTGSELCFCVFFTCSCLILFFIQLSSTVFWSLLLVLFVLFESFQSKGQKRAFLCHVSVALTRLIVIAAGSCA